jgi:hypothetical protein
MCDGKDINMWACDYDIPREYRKYQRLRGRAATFNSPVQYDQVKAAAAAWAVLKRHAYSGKRVKQGKYRYVPWRPSLPEIDDALADSRESCGTNHEMILISEGIMCRICENALKHG